MSSNRRKLRIINSVTVNMGCSCRRPRLADIFRPKPKSKHDQQQQQHKSRLNTNGATRSSSATCYYNTNTNSSSSSWGKATTLDDDEDEDNSNTTFDTPTYSEPESDPCSSKLQGVQMCGKIGESLAVVKDSDDPYLDFRHSMLQMILEKEIYSRDDLRELLDCFLSLNSPYHHEIIVRAFTEIWNGVFSMKQHQQQQQHQQQRQRVRRRKSREY